MNYEIEEEDLEMPLNKKYTAIQNSDYSMDSEFLP